MPQTFSRVQLSGAPTGSGILAPASGGLLVHGSAGSPDEVWLYAANQGVVTATVQLWWAQPAANTGNGSGGSKIEATLAVASGLTLLVPGLGLSSGLYVNCSASSANTIVVYGFANRIV